MVAPSAPVSSRRPTFYPRPMPGWFKLSEYIYTTGGLRGPGLLLFTKDEGEGDGGDL